MIYISPLSAGWMSDIVGSYMIIYYVICGLSFVPCLLWGLVPCIAHHQGQDLKTPTDLVWDLFKEQGDPVFFKKVTPDFA